MGVEESSVTEEYDIVVAGGGPAGLQFAREVASHSAHTVAVFEANDALADNDKSTGGTFPEVIERYGLPESVLMGETGGVRCEGPTVSEHLALDNYVLDFPALLGFLGAEAERHGAEIHTGRRVLEPLLADGRVTGVRYTEAGDHHEARARLVVDATGPRAVLASRLGMIDMRAGLRGIGKEYEIAGRCAVDSLLFRFDHAAAPGGYAWTFPAGDGVFKAGVCWLDDYYRRHSGPDDGSIDDYLRRWIAGDDRWTAESVRAVHAGDAVVTDTERLAVDGLIAVGDAVSTINPLFGEGIRPGMASAVLASDAALDALAAGDCSRTRLAAYERAWDSTYGPHWRRQRAVCEFLYDFTSGQQDRFARNVGRLSEQQVERFQRYELTRRDLLDLYPFHLRDLRNVPRLLAKL